MIADEVMPRDAESSSECTAPSSLAPKFELTRNCKKTKSKSLKRKDPAKQKKSRKVIIKKAKSVMHKSKKIQPEIKKPFECNLCSETFDNGVQLGGHSSKAHPGQSSAYNRKCKIRTAREFDRECLRRAKDWFTENCEASDLDLRLSHRRQTITKIKKILMTGKTPESEQFLKRVCQK